MKDLRRPRFPLIRLGLLLVVGAVFASLVRFYIAYGQAAADLTREDFTEDRREIAGDFAAHFLFSGGVPMALFWLGIVLMGVGIVRNFRAAGRARP